MGFFIRKADQNKHDLQLFSNCWDTVVVVGQSFETFKQSLETPQLTVSISYIWPSASDSNSCSQLFIVRI